MQKFKSMQAVVAGLVASALSFAASATPASLSSGVTTAISENKPELMAIGVAVLGVCAVVFIIAKAKRTSGG